MRSDNLCAKYLVSLMLHSYNDPVMISVVKEREIRDFYKKELLQQPAPHTFCIDLS